MFENLEEFVEEWSTDENLRRCSHAAKGVFVSVFCLVVRKGHEGVLVTGDCPWSKDDVAAAIGGNMDVTLGSLAELLTKCVITQRPDGAILIPELVAAWKARNEGRERVRKYRSNASCNGSVTPGDIRGSTPELGLGLEGKEEGSGGKNGEEGKGKKFDFETVVSAFERSPAFEGLNVRREALRCAEYCRIGRKKLTERRLFYWLNNKEIPIEPKKLQPNENF